MIVYDKLWETMKTRKITSYALWEKHNIDKQTLRRLRTNQNVTTNTLNKLCEILDCKIEDILEYKKEG